MYYEDNVLKHGIIDLLIEDKDKYIIIDYKSSNIDDESYIKQLNGYKDYIKKIGNKEVECYLYSIFKKEFKKV